MEHSAGRAMRFSIILTVLLLSFVNPLSASDHTVIQCTIYGKSGEILRSFPYRACIFLENGSLLVSDRTGVGLLSEKLERKWFRKMDTHHQLKLSNDGSRIMVMSSDIRRWKGKKTRFDSLLILNMQGEELKKFTFFNKTDFFLAHDYGPNAGKMQEIDLDMRREASVTHEFSHANSFHEIGANNLAGKHSVFAAGNFLVNDNKTRLVFVLDRHLRKILWSMPQDQKKRPSSFHDVQLTAEGKLLVYRNRTPNDSGLVYSTLVEIDPITKSEQVLYERSPPESFYSPFCGGIQRLPSGNLVFDDFTKGAESVELDKDKRVARIVRHHVKNEKSGLPEVYQESKRFDLTEFLKNNIGL